MTETTIVFLPSSLSFSAKYSFITAENMPCGERQVDRLSANSGYLFSQNFTHPGQHEVKSGSFSPDFNLSANSFDSSITVRSAPKLVSNTMSNPIILRAATSLPKLFSPLGIPKLSPTATRTAGAI
jgi:hypothetical protein